MILLCFSFREWIGGGVVGALRRGGAACAPAALDAVCALMQPMHQEPDLRQEQLNKASMLSSPAFLDSLLSMWAEHVVIPSGLFFIHDRMFRWLQLRVFIFK